MDTVAIAMDREEAGRLMRKYREHRAYSTPIDFEIERIYREIAKGGVVIRAIESIRKAGVDAYGMPKLAIVRADAAHCFLEIYGDGSARMADARWLKRNAAFSRLVEFPRQTFTGGRRSGEAVVPHVPPDIRPKRGLANYHILFEAVWRPVPPVDPMLLRRIGTGDTWLVVGAWNLTEVERAAMADRIRVR